MRRMATLTSRNLNFWALYLFNTNCFLGKSSVLQEKNDRGYKCLDAPSSEFLEFVCSSFAILDFTDAVLKTTSVRKLCEICLDIICPQIYNCVFNTKNFAIKMVVNIFYSNKQKLMCDNARKESVKEFKLKKKGIISFCLCVTA